MLLSLFIILLIIYIVYKANKKPSSSETVVCTQESTHHKPMNNYSPDVIHTAEEALSILEQGAKLYLECLCRRKDKNDFVGAVMNIKKENNSGYSVSVMCSYPELVSVCNDLNIFSKYPLWQPALLANGTIDYWTIKRNGSLKINSTLWLSFEQKIKEMVSQKHPEWIYTGQKMTNFTIVFE